MKRIRAAEGEHQTTSNQSFTFSIAAHREAQEKAFEVMTQNLYSDRIAAVIREICCNAADAHKMAGVAKPFEVWMPTQINPTFRVRDYGHGLDQEDIQRLYCTLFESNKSDSNEFTGYLGLGSKSPFAYTSQFTVESIHAGVKTVYAVSKTVGLPVVDVLYSGPSDEESGILVCVPVEKADIKPFSVKSAQILVHFSCEFKAHGLNISQNKPLVDLPTVKIYKKIQRNPWNTAPVEQSLLLMGNVAYPIDVSKFPSWKDCPGKSLITQNLCIITAPIGSVSVAPSREELSYDDITTKYIKLIAEECVKEVVEHINNELKNCVDWFDKFCKIEEYSTISIDNVYDYSFLPSNVVKDSRYYNARYYLKLNFPQHTSGDTYYCFSPMSFSRQFTTQCLIKDTRMEVFTNPDSIYYRDVKTYRPAIKLNGKHATIFDKSTMEMLVKAGLPARIFKPISSLPKPPASKKGKRKVIVYKDLRLDEVTTPPPNALFVEKRGLKYIGPDGEPLFSGLYDLKTIQDKLSRLDKTIILQKGEVTKDSLWDYLKQNKPKRIVKFNYDLDDYFEHLQDVKEIKEILELDKERFISELYEHMPVHKLRVENVINVQKLVDDFEEKYPLVVAINNSYNVDKAIKHLKKLYWPDLK